MNPARIFLISIIRDQICKNLTFKDADSLRCALNLPSLKCPISIQLNNGRILTFDGINQQTIKICKTIRKHGSRMVLQKYIVENQVSMAKILLKSGYDANMVDQYGDLALMVAVDYDNLEIIKLLLEYGADINAKTRNEKTALTISAQKESFEATKLLLETGNTTIQDRRAAGLIAMQKSFWKIVELLLGYKFLINQHDPYGAVILLAAARDDQYEVVKILLDSGLNVNIEDQYGWTALVEAVNYNRKRIIELLKSYGAV